MLLPFAILGEGLFDLRFFLLKIAELFFEFRKSFSSGGLEPLRLIQLRLQLHGAAVEKIPGARPRATEALMEEIERSDSVYASHSWHPLFLEGLRTMAYEITEQLEWSAPDYVCCPVGGGSILLGLFLGFTDLLEAGVVERLPRLIAIQAENVSPVCSAFAAGEEEVAPAPNPQPTLAEGIALVQPARHRELLQALRSCDGRAVAVSEADIEEGVRALGRQGFFVEPTSAVVWKGLTKLHAEEPFAHGSTIVTILSGHGLKASEKLAELCSDGDSDVTREANAACALLGVEA